jgi:hypothetical protein
MAVATNTRAAKRDATTAYVALNYTDGVRIYKTTNCGISWSLVSIQNSLSSHTPCGLCIIPSNPDIVLLMTEDASYSYIYRSADGGLTFTQKLQIARNTTGCSSGNFLRFGSGRILAFLSASYGTPPSGSDLDGYTSDDNGITWTKRVCLANVTGYMTGSKILSMVEYSNGATCIIGQASQVYNPGKLFIVKTSNYGVNWTNTTLSVGNPSSYYTAVIQLANDNIVALAPVTVSGKVDLYISSDLGATWTKKTTDLAQVGNITSTKNRLIFYSSTDNKIYISNDEGTTIIPVATVSGFINSFLLF